MFSSGFNPDSSASTHDSRLIGDRQSDNSAPMICSDFRIIEPAKFVRQTIEAKYPTTYNRYPLSPFTACVVDALSFESASPEDAITLLKGSKALYEDKPDPITSVESEREEIDQLYKKYNIDFADVISQSFQAMYSEIDVLNLPADIQKQVTEAITNVHVEKSYLLGPQASIDGKTVTLNPAVPFYLAMHISKLVGCEITGDLIKTFIAEQCAHELGHIIDRASAQGSVDPKLTASSTVLLESDYPIKFEDTDSQNKLMQQRERFAMYFAYAAVKKMGLSVEAVSDFKSEYLSLAMEVLTKITPKRLTDLLDAAKQQLAKDDQLLLRIESLADSILDGHPLAQAFPLSKEQVYQSLVSINSPQKRLESLLWTVLSHEFEAKQKSKTPQVLLP